MLTLSSFSVFTGWWHCESHKDEYKWPVGRRSEWAQRAFPLYACQNLWPSKPRWKRVIDVALFPAASSFSPSIHSFLWVGKHLSHRRVTLHCRRPAFFIDWQTLHVWNAQWLPRCLYHSHNCQRGANCRVLLDHKLEILVEAHKWRELTRKGSSHHYPVCYTCDWFCHVHERKLEAVARHFTLLFLKAEAQSPFCFSLEEQSKWPLWGNSVLNSLNLALLFFFPFGLILEDLIRLVYPKRFLSSRLGFYIITRNGTSLWASKLKLL